MKKNKKLWIIIGIAILVVLLGIGGYQAWKSQHEKAVYDSLKMTFVKERVVEYGTKVEPKKLIESYEGNLKKCPTIDTKKVGKVSLTYVLEKEDITKDFKLDLEIKDTKKPVIKFKKDKIRFTEGASFTAKDNLESVNDPVDGKLLFAKESDKLEKGTYQIKDEVDPNVPGDYKVTVRACDKNGNQTSASFDVKVDKKKVVVKKEDVTPQAQPKPKPAAPSNTQAVKPSYINGILLVNRNHPLPRSFGGTDPVAYEALQRLIKAANKAGHQMPILSGYRSYDEQVYLYNMYCERDGQAAADRYSARPGTSEHQSGLAFDIGAIDNNYGEYPGGIWLEKHCADFGFIIRFPQGKEHITGYMYEPWHVRYVGVDHAKYIMSHNLCLEEYLNAD